MLNTLQPPPWEMHKWMQSGSRKNRFTYAWLMYLYIISNEFLSTHGLVYSGLTSKYLGSVQQCNRIKLYGRWTWWRGTGLTCMDQLDYSHPQLDWLEKLNTFQFRDGLNRPENLIGQNLLNVLDRLELTIKWIDKNSPSIGLAMDWMDWQGTQWIESASAENSICHDRLETSSMEVGERRS